LLGGDLSLIRLNASTFGSGVLLDLSAALEADTTFRPGGVAYDSAADELLVGSVGAARVAHFRRTGAFLGFSPEFGDVELAQISGAVGFDPVTSKLYFGGRAGIQSSDGGPITPAPGEGGSDFAVRDGLVILGHANPGEGVLLPVGASLEDASIISFETPFRAGGFSFGGDGEVVRTGIGGSQPTATFLIEENPHAAVTDWLLY
jgi:hypothetical protein